MESHGILPGAGLAGHPDHAEDHKKRKEWLLGRLWLNWEPHSVLPSKFCRSLPLMGHIQKAKGKQAC